MGGAGGKFLSFDAHGSSAFVVCRSEHSWPYVSQLAYSIQVFQGMIQINNKDAHSLPQ